ncbi:MAG: hypothetical protein WC718_15455 [Phycisphaerales bacterium]|jgi:hypothetical protein
MNDFLLRVYCGEVAQQCNRGIMAYQQMRRLVTSPSSASDIEEHIGTVFQALNNVLTCAANVSKLLTTPNKKPLVTDRGEALSKRLNVLASSPVHNRILRNHVEHFDERIDTWAATDPNHIWASDFVGPLNIAVIHGANIPVRRRYDPMTDTFHFLSDQIELYAVKEELRRIQLAADEVINPVWPDTPDFHASKMDDELGETHG